MTETGPAWPDPETGDGSPPVARGALRRALAAHPDAAGALAFGLLAALVYVSPALAAPTPLDYFVRLASAFLEGRYWLTEGPSWLNELVPVGDRWYVVYPPMPAILLVPFVALFGPDVPQNVVCALFGGVSVGLAWLLVRRLGLALVPAALLTAVFGFGTVHWWAASTGSAWLLGHVVAVMCSLAAILLALDRRAPYVAGLLLGAALLARLPVALTFVFPLALYAELPWPFRLRTADLLPAARRVLPFVLGLGAVVLVYFAYNVARWGTIVDRGYTLIPGVLEDQFYVEHGIFAIEHIPRHLYAIFLRSWNYVDDPPFIQPSWWGLGLFFTTPLFLWLLRARLTDPRVAWALVATALTLVPIVTHGNIGVAQFGYRFSLDVQPLLFVALATAFAGGVSRLAWAAGIASIAACAYGGWAILIGFVAY